MIQWHRTVQNIIQEIDLCIRQKRSDEISLQLLVQKFGYSEYHFSRKFREISGMQFRDYLRFRKLAFAARQLRDTNNSILEKITQGRRPQA